MSYSPTCVYLGVYGYRYIMWVLVYLTVCSCVSSMRSCLCVLSVCLCVYIFFCGHPLKLIVPQAMGHIRANFFRNSVVLAWNSLEHAVIEAPRSQLFRERLTKIDLNSISNFRHVS